MIVSACLLCFWQRASPAALDLRHEVLMAPEPLPRLDAAAPALQVRDRPDNSRKCTSPCCICLQNFEMNITIWCNSNNVAKRIITYNHVIGTRQTLRFLMFLFFLLLRFTIKWQPRARGRPTALLDGRGWSIPHKKYCTKIRPWEPDCLRDYATVQNVVMIFLFSVFFSFVRVFGV